MERTITKMHWKKGIRIVTTRRADMKRGHKKE